MDISLLNQFSASSANDDKNIHLWLKGASLLMDQYVKLINILDPSYSQEIVPMENFENENSDKMGVVLQNSGSDKSTVHNYHHLYSFILNKFENNSDCNILEIGMGTNNPNLVSTMGSDGVPGAALFAFSKYFDKANIYGADIDRNIIFNKDNIKTCYVDQLNLDSFEDLNTTFGNIKYDLIIDDGLHSIGSNFNTLLFALEHVKPDGWIVIEDISKFYVTNWFTIDYMLKRVDNIKTYMINSRVAHVYAIHKLSS